MSHRVDGVKRRTQQFPTEKSEGIVVKMLIVQCTCTNLPIFHGKIRAQLERLLFEVTIQTQKKKNLADVQ